MIYNFYQLKLTLEKQSGYYFHHTDPPPQCNQKYFLHNIERLIDFYSGPTKDLLIYSDISMEVTHLDLQSLIDQQEFRSLIRSPTCFKGKEGRCIDLMLTNRKHGFMLSQSFETGFSDFHHMIYTVLKTTYNKIPPITIKYRSYKKFSEPEFLGDVAAALAAVNPGTYDEFEDVIKQALDKHAPIKTAIHRGNNNKPHINKDMRNAIMKRTRLENIASKTKNQGGFQKYKAQRNLVVKINRMEKRQFYDSLDPTVVGKDKHFWKTFRPFFSEQSNSKESYF